MVVDMVSPARTSITGRNRNAAEQVSVVQETHSLRSKGRG